jgi:hypothetical protein
MSFTQRKPSICLCMIVKDEAGVIQRCLQSARALIDHWVICDTGSADRTQELIRSSLEGIPGELHQRPWVDFGHNRSELMGLARGKADYLLVLDADWTITAGPQALGHLTADAYAVRHTYPNPLGIEYYTRCLVRGDRHWWYVGATHEYIESEDPLSERRLEDAFITDWADGGVGRARRWRQDAQILEQALEQDPENARNVFYLAQTYRDLGETARAIEFYRRRAALGGWDQEVFYALYQVGVLHSRLGDWTAAVPALVEGWNYRPSRIEPLYQLALGYRERGAHQAAHLFALRALNRPQPGDALFVEPWIYRWGVLFEYSICAYWVGDTQAALQACDRLLAMPQLPDAYREQTEANRTYCVGAVYGRPSRATSATSGLAMVRRRTSSGAGPPAGSP